MSKPALRMELQLEPPCRFCEMPLGADHDDARCWCCGSCVACACAFVSGETVDRETGYRSSGSTCTTHRRGRED